MKIVLKVKRIYQIQGEYIEFIQNENITTKIQEKINVTIQKIRKKNLSIKEDNL